MPGQTTTRFAGGEPVWGMFDDDVAENGGVHKRLHVGNGLFRQRRTQFVREAAAIDREDLDERARGDCLDLDIVKRMRKTVHK